MSYSISNLFKAMAENPKQADGKLFNPDIPESHKSQSYNRVPRAFRINANLCYSLASD